MAFGAALNLKNIESSKQTTADVLINEAVLPIFPFIILSYRSAVLIKKRYLV